MSSAGAATPALYPLRSFGTAVEVVRLDEPAYAAASFLDERLSPSLAVPMRQPWTDLLADAPAAPRAHTIFHIGHVGSTLLSRLVGEHPALFSLREPVLLRGPALGLAAPPLSEQMRVFARTWRPSQTAVVKATSFVSEHGVEIITAVTGAVVLMAVTPPVYLRTILAGSASPGEAVQLAPLRQRRLERRLNRPLQVTSLGELIAMSWLSEMLSLTRIEAFAPDRCLWLDFERFLAEPEAALGAVLAHLGAPLAVADVADLVRGRLMGRYAKAPEHGYDAALRRSVLDQAAREHAGELRAGMDWLGSLMRDHSDVRAALERSAAMGRKPDRPGPA